MRSKVICILGLFLIFPTLLFAQESSLFADLRNIFTEEELDWMGNMRATLGLQTGYIRGDTTYHINFTEAVIYEGESELEFPLDNFLLGVEAALAYKNPYNEKQDRARLTLGWFTDITNDAGEMKDSDWLNDAYDIYYYGTTHPGLDIYSESEADADVDIIDINYVFSFYPAENISIGPMVGYRYQKFEYEISDTNQVGYGPYAGDYTTYVTGNTLDYEVEYKIPYFGFNTNVLFGDKFQLNLRFGYSPSANAEDRDDHILRYKLSEGDCDGDAYIVNVDANWQFLPNWVLQISGEFTDIDTDGTQHQSYYAGPYVGVTSDVDDRITSCFWIASAVVKYRF